MGEARACPFCAETILAQAIKCKHCGSMLDGSAPAPAGRQMYVDRDDEHLRLLSTFYYVMSALSALFGTFPLVHLLVGLWIVLDPSGKGIMGQHQPPSFVGWLFVSFGLIFFLWGWMSAIFQFVTARRLRARTGYGICVFSAVIPCFWIPHGTVLGVFTLVVLNRTSVQELFRDPGSGGT